MFTVYKVHVLTAESHYFQNYFNRGKISDVISTVGTVITLFSKYHLYTLLVLH